MAEPFIIERGSIAFEEGKITDIQDSLVTGKSNSQVEYIDLKGKYIMPSLVNSHIHFTMWRSFGSIKEQHDTSTQCIKAIRASINCLKHGITATREMGHKDNVHLQLRNAIDCGLIEGPKIFSAGNAIVMSFGHAYFICNPVDNSEELVTAIRQQVNEGCDFIKIIASNDDLWRLCRTQFPVPWFSESDLRIASDTAHEIGIPITAHANGIETINRVIEAGFDSIEHGIYLDASAASKMAEKGMYFIPTMTGYKQNSNPIWNRGTDWTKRYAALWDVHLESVKHAVKKNVMIATGTDTLGDVVEEMELLKLAGQETLETLRAATINGARLIKMDEKIGSLEVGKCADFIVVDGNPIDDFQKIRNIDIVVKDGKAFTPETLDQLLPHTSSFAPGW